VRDTPGIALGICQHRAARQQDQHILLRAQNPRGVLHGMRINHRRSKCGQCISNHTAFVPRRVGRQDQRGDLSRRGARRLNGIGGIAPHIRGVLAGAYPCRHAARKAVGISRERRIKRAVIGGLIADDVDNAASRAPRVVQVREPVRKARPAMQQRGRRLAFDAVVTIGHAGDHVLLQAQHAAHAGALVQRGDEVHLAGAGVCEAGVDAGLQQGFDETFCTIHRGSPDFGCSLAVAMMFRDGDLERTKRVNQREIV